MSASQERRSAPFSTGQRNECLSDSQAASTRVGIPLKVNPLLNHAFEKTRSGSAAWGNSSSETSSGNRECRQSPRTKMGLLAEREHLADAWITHDIDVDEVHTVGADS